MKYELVKVGGFSYGTFKTIAAAKKSASETGAYQIIDLKTRFAIKEFWNFKK